MDSLIFIVTTVDKKEEGITIARKLVDERLVACAQLTGPITSSYHWDGKLESSVEFTLTLKTVTPLFDKVASRIKELHSYDLPEVVAQTISNCSSEYGEWVRGEVKNE